jgi:hypothetical protein
MIGFGKISSKVLAKFCKVLAFYGFTILIFQLLFYYVARLLAFAANINLKKPITPLGFTANLLFSVFLIVVCSYLYHLGEKWDK